MYMNACMYNMQVVMKPIKCIVVVIDCRKTNATVLFKHLNIHIKTFALWSVKNTLSSKFSKSSAGRDDKGETYNKMASLHVWCYLCPACVFLISE